jgi:hypothetical protein
LFSVDYVDPAYDNFLFQLFHILDDNNLEYWLSSSLDK